MKNLSENIQRGLSNSPAYNWYIRDNPRVSERFYELASNVKEYDSAGNEIKDTETHPEGAKIKIIDPKLTKNGMVQVLIRDAGLGYKYIPIASIRKPLPSKGIKLFTESGITKSINEFILGQGGPINIKIANKLYEKISYASDVKIDDIKNPRSNIVLHANKTIGVNDSGSIYIGYRPGNRSAASSNIPKDWSKQYVSPGEYKTLKESVKNKLNRKRNTRLDDDNLKKLLFGSKAGSITSTFDNIQCIGSGLMGLQQHSDGQYYEMSFSKVFIHAGNFLKHCGEGKPYEPIMDTKYNRVMSKTELK